MSNLPAGADGSHLGFRVTVESWRDGWKDGGRG